ncbi:MAG: hypothetical protein CL610_05215 [Anaerolineaceae bacterium]|nr:hypothetical protein [Anaerolineaceae bacterium]
MSEDYLAVARQILEIGPLVMRTLAAEMRQTDHELAPAHFRLLWILTTRSLTLSELAEIQMVSLPTMSNSITILEERGWVTRTRSTEDRRRVLIEITEAGQDVLAQVQRHAEERVRQLVTTLTDDELEKVSEGLLLLRDAFVRSSRADQCQHHHKYRED